MPFAAMNTVLESAIASEAREARAGYPESEPLPAYLSLLGSFSLVFALFFAGGGKRRPRLSRLEDAALTALATHKLTRIVAKDRVTAPLRAPFARFEESAGSGELSERVRGHGFRRAVGNLITCPYCLAPWAALALKILKKLSPDMAFQVISLLSLAAASDLLNQLYAHLKDEG
jgi:hypothetical protein